MPFQMFMTFFLDINTKIFKKIIHLWESKWHKWIVTHATYDSWTEAIVNSQQFKLLVFFLSVVLLKKNIDLN